MKANKVPQTLRPRPRPLFETTLDRDCVAPPPSLPLSGVFPPNYQSGSIINNIYNYTFNGNEREGEEANKKRPNLSNSYSIITVYFLVMYIIVKPIIRQPPLLT